MKTIYKPRFVDSGLRGETNKDILNSCIGQMSDGHYENDPSYGKYWKHCKILHFDEVCFIVVDDDPWHGSGFMDMSDEEVRHLFSSIIKNTMNSGFRNEYFKIDKKEFATSEENCPFFGYKSASFADVHKAMKVLGK